MPKIRPPREGKSLPENVAGSTRSAFPYGGVRFGEGQVGNPGGQPKAEKNFLQHARGYSCKVLDSLWNILNDPEEKGEVRVKAAEVLLERGQGKVVPADSDHDAARKGPYLVMVEKVVNGPPLIEVRPQEANQED